MGGVENSLRGQLLIASPVLTDPHFFKTVILVAEHTPEGAMGLVLNRRTPAAVADAAPHLIGLGGIDASVFVGGPVDRGSVFVLADFEEPEEAGSIVLWDVGLLAQEADPELLEAATRHARVFAGYAGWGPGQLEGELDEDAWFVEEPAESDIFTADPDRLWSAVLRRKGGQYAVISLMPDDPRLN